jgi:hypothetical protein
MAVVAARTLIATIAAQSPSRPTEGTMWTVSTARRSAGDRRRGLGRVAVGAFMTRPKVAATARDFVGRGGEPRLVRAVCSRRRLLRE